MEIGVEELLLKMEKSNPVDKANEWISMNLESLSNLSFSDSIEEANKEAYQTITDMITNLTAEELVDQLSTFNIINAGIFSKKNLMRVS